MRCHVIAFTVLWALACSGAFAQKVNVPLDYWGYQFLDRMEAKGLFFSHELRNRPIMRATMAKLLIEIDKKIAQSPGRATKTDIQLLRQIKGDLTDEIEKISSSNHLPSSREQHTAKWQEDASYGYLDLYGKQAIVSNRGDQYQPQQLLSETTLGGIIRGNLGGTLHFYLDARNAITRGESEVRAQGENFDVSKGSPVVISGPNVYRDRALAYLTVGKSWLLLKCGRDEVEWGPGFHGGLSLSRNAPPADMISISSHFRRFSFNSYHLFLRSSLGSKYLAAHRIDITVIPGLYLAGTETVVYGGRNAEFAYLNPLMPYHIAEHHLGDRDNNTMSFEISCTLLRGFKLYGEYFIDDMTSTKSLTRYFGNKFAFLCGGHWADPFKLRNVDLRWEYARIEPFVYAHHDSINIYTHYDKVIGHWLGPNSDSHLIQLDYQMGKSFRGELAFEYIRQGSGDANTKARPEEGTRKKFLTGPVEKRRLLGVRLVDQLKRDLFISISYTYSDTRNMDYDISRSSVDHLARFELHVNY
ncbi:hypothetical protein JXO59_01600 [candidate division KSB1 bacterium]|nr:hypothetical protein [candidate division KSB1 bacterium]